MAVAEDCVSVEPELLVSLSGAEGNRFLNALESPPPANAALKSLMDDYAGRRIDLTGNFDWMPRSRHPVVTCGQSLPG